MASTSVGPDAPAATSLPAASTAAGLVDDASAPLRATASARFAPAAPRNAVLPTPNAPAPGPTLGRSYSMPMLSPAAGASALLSPGERSDSAAWSIDVLADDASIHTHGGSSRFGSSHFGADLGADAGTAVPARPGPQPAGTGPSSLLTPIAAGLSRYTVDTLFTQRLRTPATTHPGVRPAAETAAPAAGRVLPDVAGAGPASRDRGPVVGPAAQDWLDAMTQPDVHLGAFVAAHFPGPQAPGATQMLAQALHQTPTLPAHAGVGLPGASRILLAQALAGVAGGDATAARHALVALQRLDPQAELAAAWRQRNAPRVGSPAPNPARAAAWRLAMSLATTPSGVDVLQAALGQPVAAAHAQDFALLLKAGAALALAPDQDPRPAVLCRRSDLAATVAGQAFACATARMVGDAVAAAPLAWTLNAVRNDLYDTGPGSDFAAIDARLAKTGTWIARAMNDGPLPQLNPLSGKSPFRALRHGVQGIERGEAMRHHRPPFEAALRSAAQGLHDAFERQGALAHAPAPDEPPLATLRAAVLAHCLALPNGQSLDRHAFDPAAAQDVAVRLARAVAGDGAAAVPALAERFARLPALRALLAEPMSLERLEHWAGEAGLESGTPVAAQLGRARDEATGRDTRVTSITPDTLKTALKEVIASIQGSSRLRLTSGGIVAVGLKSLSEGLSLLSSALFVRAKLDARRQAGRQAVFELAMPPYDMEIMLGTQRQTATQLGFGVALGPTLGPVKIGPSIDLTAYSGESSTIRGVSLRLPRIGRDVGELRRDFSRLIERLVDGTTGESRGPVLRQLLQDFPELTVNRIGAAGDQRRRHALSVEVSANAGVPMVRGIASLGGAAEYQPRVARHYLDASGAMRVDRRIEGQLLRGSLGGRATAGLHEQVGQVQLTSGMTDLPPLGATAELLTSGAARRSEFVREAGRLVPASFVEVEYQNVDAFADAVAAKARAWVARRLAVDPARDADAEAALLARFLDGARRGVTPTQTFAARENLTPATIERVAVYDSGAQLAERLPGAARAQEAVALREAAEACCQDPGSHQPFSLRIYERAAAQDVVGLNAVVQLAALHAADGAHIHQRLDT